MNAKTLFAGTSIAVALAAAAVPVHATDITFATFSALTNDNFYFKNAKSNNTSASASYYSIATSTSTTPGSVDIDFSFINDGATLDNAVKNVKAVLTLTGTAASDPASLLSGNHLFQPLLGGSFTITSTAPITVGHTTYASGSLLLGATWGGATIYGKSGGGTLGADNVSPDTLTYSSDFVTFKASSVLDSQIALTSITPALGVVTSGVDALKTFKADATGEFDANPAPKVNGVPEPTSWALMMVGFGLAGATIRRRTRVQAAA